VAPAEQASQTARSLKTNFSAARNTERATQRPGLRARPLLVRHVDRVPFQNDLAHGGRSSPRFLAVRARPLDVLEELASVSGEPHRQLRETGPSDWALARAPELASKASNTGATGGRGCGPNTTQEFSLRRPGNLKVRPVFGASGAGAVLDDEHAAVRVDRAAAVKRGAVDDRAPTPTPAPCSSACCGRVCRG
jgi:hypothetical protein